MLERNLRLSAEKTTIRNRGGRSTNVKYLSHGPPHFGQWFRILRAEMILNCAVCWNAADKRTYRGEGQRWNSKADSGLSYCAGVNSSVRRNLFQGSLRRDGGDGRIGR